MSHHYASYRLFCVLGVLEEILGGSRHRSLTPCLVSSSCTCMISTCNVHVHITIRPTYLHKTEMCCAYQAKLCVSCQDRLFCVYYPNYRSINDVFMILFPKNSVPGLSDYDNNTRHLPMMFIRNEFPQHLHTCFHEENHSVVLSVDSSP